MSLLFSIIILAAVFPNGYSAPQGTQIANKTCGSENPTAVPLYGYYNSKNGDHFYTIHWSELEGGKGAYAYEGVKAYIFASPTTGTSAFYRYVHTRSGDHFYTTNWAELGSGSKGYVYEGIQGYIYPNPITGTVPLFRYFNGDSGDHFYTTNWGQFGGYVHEGNAGFVFP